MKLTLPTGWPGQLLALGLPVLILVLLWLGVAMPLIEWHDDRDAMLARRFALADRMEALVATVPALRAQATAAAASGTGEQALLEGDNDSTASASLQERLQAMFLQAGVQLNSVETVPGAEAGAFRRIGLRISFAASWPALVSLLKDMHVATPVLVVDELQVQPALHRISTAPGTYDVLCSVYAFRSGAIGVTVR
jgi:Type II secretion system (T2SS), protein M subtype b